MAMFVLFAVVVFGVGGLVAYLTYQQAKKRREALAAYAAQKGWSWTQRDDRWVDFGSTSPFGQGHSRHADNVLQGQHDGRTAVAFDYRYNTTETSTDAQGHTTSREVAHPFSITALDAGAAFPALSVTPEGFFGRLAGRITGNDIELESEDFNRAFTVHCPDRKFASDVLHPRTMEFLLAHPDAQFCFEGKWVLSAHPGRHSIEQLDQRLAVLDTLLDQVPDFVWREAGR
jgi:hypothetical protein